MHKVSCLFKDQYLKKTVKSHTSLIVTAKNKGYKDIVTGSQLRKSISSRRAFCNTLPVLFTHRVASISNQFLSVCDHLQVGIFMTEGEKQ